MSEPALLDAAKQKFKGAPAGPLLSLVVIMMTLVTALGAVARDYVLDVRADVVSRIARSQNLLTEKIERSAESVLAAALLNDRKNAGDSFGRADFFQALNRAMASRDGEFMRVRSYIDEDKQKRAAVEALLTAYQDKTEQLLMVVRACQTDHREVSAQVTSLIAQSRTLENELANVARKQDNVRETRIPEVMNLIESHISSPHGSALSSNYSWVNPPRNVR